MVATTASASQAPEREWVVLAATMPDGTERKVRFLEEHLEQVREELPGLDAAELLRAQAQVLTYWLDHRVEGYQELRLVQHYRDVRELEYVWRAAEATVDHLALALGDNPLLTSEGEYWARRRQLGPVTVNWGKEEGPPPWPLPRVQMRLRGARASVGVGWRMTAYQASVRPGWPLAVALGGAGVALLAMAAARSGAGRAVIQARRPPERLGRAGGAALQRGRRGLRWPGLREEGPCMSLFRTSRRRGPGRPHPDPLVEAKLQRILALQPTSTRSTTRS
jgi:hypothetical protein